MYPKILDLGPVTIHTYGLLLAAGFHRGHLDDEPERQRSRGSIRIQSGTWG